jgi:hypothetical protein
VTHDISNGCQLCTQSIIEAAAGKAAMEHLFAFASGFVCILLWRRAGEEVWMVIVKAGNSQGCEFLDPTH